MTATNIRGGGSDRGECAAATMEDEAREWAELFKDNDLGWAEHADDLDEAATFILALLAEIDRLRRVES